MKAQDISSRAPLPLASLLVLTLSGCGEQATLPASAGFGPHPLLPPPHPTRIPTLNFARAVGWPAGAMDVAADHAGALLVADDVGGVVWRVTRRAP